MILELPYRREHAVAYARRWALSRNPLFYDFSDLGGDCTNFVSQAVLAGSCTMDPTPTYGWYYRSSSDRAPAWTSVSYFFDFLAGTSGFVSQNAGIGPYGRQVSRADCQIGDAIQLANADGGFYHTLLISSIQHDEILVCAHTIDALDRPLTSYNYATARYLHIDGVRVSYSDDACYLPLLEGTALPAT